MKLNENLARGLLIASIGITALTIVLFLFTSNKIETSSELDTDKFNHFGAFIAGSAGILISFAGTVLIYVSLNHQREDIRQNREALSMQIDELKNQREELELTREVFKQQSLTAEIQRFENTFFNLIKLLNENKNSIEYKRTTVWGQNEPKPVIQNGDEALKTYLDRVSRNYLHEINKVSDNNLIQTKVFQLQIQIEKNLIPNAIIYFNTYAIILELLDSWKQDKNSVYARILLAQTSQIDVIAFSHILFLDLRKGLFLKYGVLSGLVEDCFCDKEFYYYFSKITKASN